MSATAGPRLAVSDLTAGYNGSVVINGVTFEVNPGEVVALLGRNGVGKTTLVRTLCGSLRPTSGEVRLGGVNVTRWAPSRRHRAGLRSVRQAAPVFAGMTVEHNLRLAGVTVQNAAGSFPFIRERGSQLAGSLSGGEQKMLAMARQAGNPGSCWVLDEPTEGLQPRNVERCGELIRAAASAGCAVLLVEQHLAMALASADRYAVMVKGELVRHGKVQDDSAEDVAEALRM